MKHEEKTPNLSVHFHFNENWRVMNQLFKIKHEIGNASIRITNNMTLTTNMEEIMHAYMIMTLDKITPTLFW